MIDTRRLISTWTENHWLVDRPLNFRVHGGRKSRQSHITQRTLNYLLVKLPPDDLPALGSWLHPDDDAQSLRHGFRTAIVRRIESDPAGDAFALLEIVG
ncbi:MAG: hypothetical protein JJU36_14425 [Phycisphaeraceae bacterium]|nr:hypothetical protein [Phycisphaeraceae bacterium]